MSPGLRTVVDLARTLPFTAAVVVADFALHYDWKTPTPLATREQLLAEVEGSEIERGRKRISAVLAFADGRSGSPLESESRVVIRDLGFRAPDLQHEFIDARGRMFSDFFWEEENVAGECDGRGKYLDAHMRGTLSIEEVVLREKYRENRIRALGPTVARWEAPEVWEPMKLRAILLDAGLRPIR